MGTRVAVREGTDVLRTLERRGLEYLTVRPTRAVVILEDGILWVDVLEGRLESASRLELRPVEAVDRADEYDLVERFQAILERNGVERPS